MKLIKRTKKGFTLVELIVVIAIVAILAAVSVVSYLAFINQANESADIQLVKQLNVALQADEALNDTRDTMKEMLVGMEAQGFVVENLTKTKSGYDIVWDQEHNRFALLNSEDKVIYSESSFSMNNNNMYTLWKFADTEEEASNKKYSVYLTDEFAKTDATELIVNAGLDVGNYNKLQKISYINDASSNQNVVIRTNSANATIVIDDASEGTIYHYGVAGALNIIECHTASYHENGTVAFAEIAKGRIVLESGSEINHIHINANENADGFEEVIIADNGAKALPEAITRDQVDVSEPKAVVTVESGSISETVYVYPYTDAQQAKTGTTEQTETQNTSISSALGQLVLDDGNDAGEKAMSNNEKEAAKAETVAQAIQAEEDAAPAWTLNGALYTTSDEAIAVLAETTEATLVLNKDITIVFGAPQFYITIHSGTTATIDLNGHKINVTDTNLTTSAFIKNQGTLIIKDSTDTEMNGTGKGAILYEATHPDYQSVPKYANNLISNYGNLTIESGYFGTNGIYNSTFANNGYASYVIDNYSGGTTTINGGKLYREAQYSYAVRMFCNSTTNLNKVVVNGGIIEGGYAFWMQTPNNNANMAELIVNGGTFIAHDGFALFFGGAGSTSDGRNYSNTSIVFNGGTLNRVGVAGVPSEDNAPAKFEISSAAILELSVGANITPTYK